MEVGGPASYLLEVQTLNQLSWGLDFAEKEHLPVLILGGGSNLLVHDNGFAGLVLVMQTKGIQSLADGVFEVAAGEVWDDFVRHTVELGFSGVECLSGIPGTVGACPIQNIGAYGQEVAETIDLVEVWDRQERCTSRILAADCGFAYRFSNFKSLWAERFVVTSVRFRLRREASHIRYGELSKKLETSHSSAPSPLQVRQAVLEIRASKSMVYDRQDPNHRSSGSFFVNPVVSAPVAEQIGSQHPQMPRYAAPEGSVKLSAAWLIEKAGFPKGYQRGPAGLSTNHVLALINRGGAEARDIWSLAREVQDKVQSVFGVSLHPEPVRVGFPSE